MNGIGFIRSAYNYDWKKASDEAGTPDHGPSLVRREFQDECDINVIVENFGLSGDLPQVRAPMYGDFTEIGDYRSALEAVRSAEASFMAMPAEVRARFANDPQQFLEFCEDEGNREEARELGLLFEKPEPPDGDAPGGAKSVDVQPVKV